MNYSANLQQKNIRSSSSITVSIVVLLCVIQVLIQPTNGYLNITQYCQAFDENFQPIICLIKNGTKLRPNYHPPPQQHPQQQPQPYPTQYPILQPDYVDSEDDDSECSCEVTCFPRIIHQRSLLLSTGHNENSLVKKRDKRTASTSYRCRSCGTECSVSTTRPPTCYCAIPASKSECTCTATCAMFRDDRHYYFQNRYNDGDDEANCIMSVTALEDWRLGEERPPYVCECKRSKEAENSSRPDFICICQRINISRDFKNGKFRGK